MPVMHKERYSLFFSKLKSVLKGIYYGKVTFLCFEAHTWVCQNNSQLKRQKKRISCLII